MTIEYLSWNEYTLLFVGYLFQEKYLIIWL